MDFHSLYLWLAIVFGFLMAWGIGANDVSNAMGTSVGSKAITIKQAIIIAAVFEFLGAFIAGSEVTHTIKQNIIDINLFNNHEDLLVIGMLSSLLAAALWLFVASIFGWPVSTTHTIVGAIMGFGMVEFGHNAIQWSNIIYILLGWLFSPLFGCVIAFSLFVTTQVFIFNKDKPLEHAKKVIPYYLFLTIWIISMISISRIKNIGIDLLVYERILVSLGVAFVGTCVGKLLINRLNLDPKADKKFHFANVEKLFAILMLFTACAMAFAHGSNDVANAVGPVAAIVSIVSKKVNSGIAENSNSVPIRVLLLGATGIVFGLATYGHKVIATVGNKITQLTPSRGFSATLAAATTVVLASSSGLPISTTHTLVGGIFGVGLARGIAALNLQVIRSIILSWIVTVPIGAALSVGIFLLLKNLTLNLS